MFSDRFRSLRQERKITQEELGRALNKTKNNISQYETGKREPDNDTLFRIADYFSVSVDYLLGRTEIREPADKILNRYIEGASLIVPYKKDDFEEDLPHEAKEEIEKYKEYIRYKYGKQ